jgi:sRNA-binding carbon storage regulator CsrA
MMVHELQAGDEVLLDEGVRVRVLAVEGDTVLLGVILPEPAQIVGVEALEGRWPLRAALTAAPSVN